MDFFRRHKILSGFIVLCLVLFFVVAWRTRGPYRSYRADIVKTPGASPVSAPLQVGVAIRNITPDLEYYDPWNDADGNGRYEPDKGDTYTDRNGNGKFDAVWMAGFNNNRPAKGVNDPLWARAIAIRNNDTTVVLVSIDSIGILHEKFIEIRKMLNPSLGIDHVMFSTTHNHEAPDTLGIWSYSISPTAPYFDRAYLDFVQSSAKGAIEEAVDKLQPAEMILAEAPAGPDGFMDDSRKPLVYDHMVRCARFVKPGTDDTIATFVEWGNHVETLGNGNSLITSDFVHFLREGLENGVGEPNGVEGFGGTCVYFQGMIGGLMTQLHTTVPHRDGERTFADASFDKAQALGENLAIVAANALRGDSAWKSVDTRVAIAAKTIFIPMEGPFAWASFLGFLHPGWYWGEGRTEINAFRIGDMEILTIPGELYPEIAYGGIETPEGADFPIEPIEVPPIHPQMKGKLNVLVGMANDEIGYIIPKSQWDVEPPYAYGRDKKPQYGEVNSCGPDVAKAIHRESLDLLGTLHQAIEVSPLAQATK